MTKENIDRLTRADREIITRLIPDGAHVLDLGCGDGGLLAELKSSKKVVGRGVDIDSANLIVAMERGLPVYQGNLDKGLMDFPSGSYDYVILNQTLQVITKPRTVLREMLRIGRYGIVGFPNFGHWYLRTSLLFTGRMPVSKTLPFTWHETPNIHQLTIRDFRDFCLHEGYRIMNEEYLMLGKWRRSALVNPFANFLAQTGMFIIGRTDT